MGPLALTCDGSLFLSSIIDTLCSPIFGCTAADVNERPCEFSRFAGADVDDRDFLGADILVAGKIGALALIWDGSRFLSPAADRFRWLLLPRDTDGANDAEDRILVLPASPSHSVIFNACCLLTAMRFSTQVQGLSHLKRVGRCLSLVDGASLIMLKNPWHPDLQATGSKLYSLLLDCCIPLSNQALLPKHFAFCF